MLMNIIEKRDYIHSYLHQVKEPAIDELYNKMVSYLSDALIEESEDDIKKGDVTSHAELKQEVLSWMHLK
ncbi:MAG: hypothetical protein ACQEQ0_12160 [Bacteroidota bacterium]